MRDEGGRAIWAASFAYFREGFGKGMIGKRMGKREFREGFRAFCNENGVTR
jgi:hypothetical protein